MDIKTIKRKEQAFDAYCRRLLKNELRDIYRERHRQTTKEVLFSELSQLETRTIFAEPLSNEERFYIVCHSQQTIVVEGASIAEAILELPEIMRDIILLAYFLNKSDKAIGIELAMPRSTVQYQRTRALNTLKTILTPKINNSKTIPTVRA